MVRAGLAGGSAGRRGLTLLDASSAMSGKVWDQDWDRRMLSLLGSVASLWKEELHTPLSSVSASLSPPLPATARLLLSSSRARQSSPPSPVPLTARCRLPTHRRARPVPALAISEHNLETIHKCMIHKCYVNVSSSLI